MPTLRVRIVVLAVLMAAAVVITSACGSDLAANRTGVRQVDRVLDAIESDEAEQIEAVLSLGLRPCRRLEPTDMEPPAGVSIIECREGEPTGTLVNTAWSGACEGSYWYRADPEDAADRAKRFVEWDLELYGVFPSRPVANEYFVTSDYVAIFGTNQDGAMRGIGLFLLDGGIVGTDVDCGSSPAQMVEPGRLGDPILIVNGEG